MKAIYISSIVSILKAQFDNYAEEKYMFSLLQEMELKELADIHYQAFLKHKIGTEG